MADEIHTLTDKNLRELEKRLSREYSEAQRELDEKFWKYMQDFQRKDREKAAQLAAGEITKDEYLKWRMGQALSGERWRKMRDDMTQRLVNADKIAADMINGTLPRTYTDNLNYGVFEAEKASGLRTSFELVDEDTMRRLMRDDPEIIPTVKPDIPKDMRWNRQKITSAMTQGILQGESIPKIARRLQSVTDMDKRAAIRNARTYTTAAENGGRIDGYKRAKDMGIEMEQEWLAALDSRTRSEHRQLDGVKVAVGEPWEIDGYKIRYPGDPEAAPHLIYNCRCTVVAALKELDDTAEERWSKLPEGQTYSEWKNELVRKKATSSAPKRFEDEIWALREQVKKNGLTREYVMQAGAAVLKEVNGGYLKEYNEAKAKWDEEKEKYSTLYTDQRYQDGIKIRRGFYKWDEFDHFTTEEEYEKFMQETDKKLREIKESAAYTEAKAAFDRANTNLGDERERAEKFAQIIGRTRSVGYDAKALDAHLNNSRSPMKKEVAWAYQLYPTDWIDASVARGNITPKKVRRGYYSDALAEIAISGSGNGAKETAVHELGHRFEQAVPSILDAEKSFYNRRTDGEPLERLRDITNIGYDSSEKARKDDFIEPYMGKDYGGRAYELVSMGFQYAYCEPTKLAKDPDMQQWVYGLLTLAGGK